MYDMYMLKICAIDFFRLLAFTFSINRVYQCRNNIIKHSNIYSQSWNKDLLLSYY